MINKSYCLTVALKLCVKLNNIFLYEVYYLTNIIPYGIIRINVCKCVRKGENMINEERVKELYHVALYDSKERKMHQQVSQYFKRDYVGKEILKSFFTGTIAFLLILGLMVLYVAQDFVDSINSLDFEELGVKIGISYLIFILLYLFVTWVVYAFRYVTERKKLKKYGEHLKNVNRMYVREGKLKQ